MRSFTDILEQVIESVYAAYNEDDNIYSSEAITNTAETDWLAVLIVFTLVLWICSQYYQPLEFARFLESDEPLIRAASNVVQSVAVESARFVLVFLVITLELVVKAGESIPTPLRWAKGAIFDYYTKTWEPVAEAISLRYDTINHSHYANLTRQKLRAASAWAGYAAIGIAVLGFVGGPIVKEHYALRALDIKDYVVPDWVIRAQPQNRPRDGSSSHYRPGNDCPPALSAGNPYQKKGIRRWLEWPWTRSLKGNISITVSPSSHTPEVALVDQEHPVASRHSYTLSKPTTPRKCDCCSETSTKSEEGERQFAAPDISSHNDLVQTTWYAESTEPPSPTEIFTPGSLAASEESEGQLVFHADSAQGEPIRSVLNTEDTMLDIPLLKAETGGLDLLVTAAATPATANIAAKSSVLREERMMYCKACRQYHCCEIIH